ncbi:protein inscuteable homolog [Orussus abietinus]|uniref:protein inscuteable homolog n=1 Tax=Orussus abietinus TaxID=222816 RepID=UPI000626CA50|nr:protein inscuteable homolog [Orussus abietinus]
MSRFKRDQSRVFWGRMASQDLQEDPFSRLQGPLQGLPEEGPESPQEFSSSSQENGVEDLQEDAIESKELSDNATVREVLPEDPGERVEDEVARGAEEDPEGIHRSEPRDLGRFVDFRSEDSGFSDSERSTSPDELRSKERRSGPRRRHCSTPRSRRRRRLDIQQRVDSPWRDGEVPPGPSHTSTPKQKPCVDRGALQGQLPSLKRTEKEADRKVSQERSPSTFPEECLGDFLYANEPPEDAPSAPRGSSSFGGTGNVARKDCSSRAGEETRDYRSLSAVRAWLNDLAVDAEEECGTTLQSKALPRRKLQESRTLTSLATSAATKLLDRADRFNSHYKYVIEEMTKPEEREDRVRKLARSLQEDAVALFGEMEVPTRQLPLARDRNRHGGLRATLARISDLKAKVDRAVDAQLDLYIERIVRGLEEAPRELLGGSAARGALAALTALGLAGSRAASSIARCSGIKVLLTSLISVSRNSGDLRAASLRALASVCCCPTAINRFVREGGPEIIVDLLAAESSPESEKMEAAALVVQITAPWTEAYGLQHMEPFADVLVRSLIQLAEATTCGQTLLLAAAALNHLSRSRKCVLAILDQDCVRRLLKSLKRSVGRNVWTMEQIASLVGQLARMPEARPHLARARASVALVYFLRMRPPGLEDAYKRLEDTAAAALTRLCVDPEIASQVVAVGGANCLPPGDNVDEDGRLRYTKSLRLACKKAAKQINVARAYDSSALG